MTSKEIYNLSFSHPIIAFDGVCNLCDGFVQWSIRRDKQRIIRYTALQSEWGQLLQEDLNLDLNSVVLIHKGDTYTHSDVALRCMKIIGGGWSIFSLLTIVPKTLRDGIYNFIARNRYKWFGQKEECMIPDESVKELFL